MKCFVIATVLLFLRDFAVLRCIWSLYWYHTSCVLSFFLSTTYCKFVSVLQVHALIISSRQKYEIHTQQDRIACLVRTVSMQRRADKHELVQPAVPPRTKLVKATLLY